MNWANCSQRPVLPWAPDPISIPCLFQLSLLSPSHYIPLCSYFFHQTTNRTKQTKKTAFEVLLSSCWPISLLPFIAKFLERFICSFVSFLLSLPEMYSNSAFSLTMPLKLLLPGLYFPCCSVQLSVLRPHRPDLPAAFDRVDHPFFFEACSLLSFQELCFSLVLVVPPLLISLHLLNLWTIQDPECDLLAGDSQIYISTQTSVLNSKLMYPLAYLHISNLTCLKLTSK